MSLSDQLALKAERASAIVDEYLKMGIDDAGFAESLAEAMDYAVEGKGKRIRPVILLEVYRLFMGDGCDLTPAEPFAAALEMIHSYSLVHDDLPAMDNDRLRRGKPSVWVEFSESTAILAGDALLNLAFETAARAFDECEEQDMKKTAQAFSYLAKKAGIHGMIGGQAADVESEKEEIPIDRERLLFIHRNKTGALLQAAFVCGGILGGANAEQINALETIAEHMGVAFQIQDDILDVVGNARKLGKPIGSDAQQGKETYVTLYGLEEAKAEAARLCEESKVVARCLPGDKSFLLALFDFLVDRDY